MALIQSPIASRNSWNHGSNVVFPTEAVWPTR
jgi:hypothetical protein